jgi:hypothetical protein
MGCQQQKGHQRNSWDINNSRTLATAEHHTTAGMIKTAGTPTRAGMQQQKGH